MSALKSLPQFWVDILSCMALGAIIGVLCRGRVTLALILSIPASNTWVMLGAWYTSTFSNQFSWQDPGGTIYWIGALTCFSAFFPLREQLYSRPSISAATGRK